MMGYTNQAVAKCEHRGGNESAVMAGLVTRFCPGCGTLWVLCKLENGFYFERVREEDDVADIPEDVQPVQADEGVERVPPAPDEPGWPATALQDLPQQGESGGLPQEEAAPERGSAESDDEGVRGLPPGEGADGVHAPGPRRARAAKRVRSLPHPTQSGVPTEEAP